MKIEFSIPVNLTDSELEQLSAKAGSVGLSVGEYVSDVVGDIIGGRLSGGSDERYLLSEWHNRRYDVGIFGLSFLGFLLVSGYDVEDVVDSYDYMMECQIAYEDINLSSPEYDIDTVEDIKNDLEYSTDEFYSYYNAYRRIKLEPDEEAEMSICRNWVNQFNKIKKSKVIYGE